MKNSFIDETLNSVETKNLFNFYLTKALLESGLSLNKVNSMPLKNFLETNFGKKIGDQSSLRKSYLNDIYCAAIDKIKQKIKDEFLYFVINP